MNNNFINELPTIGYVVALEGERIRVNLHEGHQGKLASHRLGISSVSQPGDLIGLNSGSYLVIARVTEMAFLEPEKAHQANVGTDNLSSMPLRQLIAYTIGFISSSNDKLKFTSEDWRLPSLGASAVPLSKEFMENIYGLDEEDAKSTLELGKDSRTKSVKIKVGLNKFLSRHIAVLGGTGYGKSNFNAMLTTQISTKYPKSRIIIFDVNGEYAQAFSGHSKVKHTILGKGQDNPTEKGEKFDKDDCNFRRIPYQAFGPAGLIKLLRPSDKTQLPALRNALAAIDKVSSKHNGIYVEQNNGSSFNLVDDCRSENQKELGQWINILRNNIDINTAKVWPPFYSLACLVAEFGCLGFDKDSSSKRDTFSYGNVLPLIKIIQQLSYDLRFKYIVDLDGGAELQAKNLHWKRAMLDEVDYFFGKEKGQEQDWNIHIVNLKNLADDHSPMILGALLEMFSEILFRRGLDKTHPTLLLLEEAHHYLRDPYAETDNQLKAYERLAKEGRKFNCSLIVSTQRPSELSSTVLAMCSNWISMRLSNEKDIQSVRSAIESGNEQTLRQISGLPRGDAIAFGSAFNLPVRITIDKISPGPKSGDAKFASDWSEEQE
ncbi:ATP-binding protein [Yersinia enterocolitica]|nr:ATP-binding protein [Yersinia enterocolitica]HDL8432966.1 ATP-binding protein [Yersinia enterocolitica]